MRSVIHSFLILSVALLSVGFLSTASGGWLIANWDGTGGANIGAGGLMLLGTTVGAAGLLTALTAAALGIIHGLRNRT